MTMPAKANRPNVPKSLTESEEAKWWDHKDMVKRNLIQAMREGTAVRGTAQRLTREPRVSRNVTIRTAEADLDLARKQTEAKGLPYQTYIKSVRHEALVKRQRRAGGLEA